MTKPTFKNVIKKALSNPAVSEGNHDSVVDVAVKRQLDVSRHEAGLTPYQMAVLKSDSNPARRGDFEAFLDAVPDVEVGIETDRILDISQKA